MDLQLYSIVLQCAMWGMDYYSMVGTIAGVLGKVAIEKFDLETFAQINFIELAKKWTSIALNK